MADSSNIVRVTATGDAVSTSVNLRAIYLCAPSATSTAEIRAGGSSGTQILSLAAQTGNSAPAADLHDVFCIGPVHVTISGSGASVTVVYA